MPVGQWLLLRPNKARLHLGDTGAVYPDDIAQMEAFARPLWAIVPMLAGHCASVKPLWAAWCEGIIAGVDPENPEYWGEVVDYDQRLVEMAVFGMGMALAPKEFFFDLPEKTQKQLHAWLDQINRRDMPKNNWTFFCVLVNMGFIVCGMPHDPHADAGQADQMRQSVGVPGAQADRGIRKVRHGCPPHCEKPTAKARPLFHVRRFADDEVIFVVTQDSVLPHEGQLVGQGAALNVEVVRQLLTVIGNVKGVAAASLDAFRKVG